MKIVSWNIYRNNKNPIELIDYIVSLSPNVICLQEVRRNTLTEIKKRYASYDVAYAEQNFISITLNKSVFLFNVILTKNSILSQSTFNHGYDNLNNRLLYKYRFSRLDINSHYVDTLTDNLVKCRIFNVHFECVLKPSERLARFDMCKNLFDENSINIVAGDFNTFSQFPISLITSTVYGKYFLEDFFINERAVINNMAKKIGLKNPFLKSNTFKWFSGQYDYILIPKTLKVIDKFLLDKCNMSDHKGLFLEIDL